MSLPKSSVGRVILVSLALVVAFSAGSALVAFGDGENVTFYGCLTPGGTLNSISVDVAPSCPPPSQLISWNQKGEKGDPGEPGTFSGVFTSDNGLYSISVTNDGIVLSGPNNSTIALDDTGVQVNGLNVQVNGTNTVVASTQTTRIQGLLVQLNCTSGGNGVARVGDPVSGSAIVAGSTSVLAC
jgi:uncharacterized Zn-binding protein involved in type VI secretion